MARTQSAKICSSDDSGERNERSREKVISQLNELITYSLMMEEEVKMEEKLGNKEKEMEKRKIAAESWKKCIKRVKMDRFCRGNPNVKEIEYKNGVGRTPLHLLSEAKAPIELIDQILKLHPEACKVKDDAEDMYPLHRACQFRADPSDMVRKETVVRHLMKKYPAAILHKCCEDSGSASPLHLLLECKPQKALVKFMIDLANQEKSGESILKMQDRENQIPLHVAVDYSAPEDVIDYLYSQYKDGVKQVTKFGATCLHIAVKNKQDLFIRKFAHRYPEALMLKVDSTYDLGGGTPLHFLFQYHPNLPPSEHKRILSYLLKPFVKRSSKFISRVFNKPDKNSHNVIDVAKRNKVSKAILRFLNEVANKNFKVLSESEVVKTKRLVSKKKSPPSYSSADDDDKDDIDLKSSHRAKRHNEQRQVERSREPNSKKKSPPSYFSADDDDDDDDDMNVKRSHQANRHEKQSQVERTMGSIPKKKRPPRHFSANDDDEGDMNLKRSHRENLHEEQPLAMTKGAIKLEPSNESPVQRQEVQEGAKTSCSSSYFELLVKNNAADTEIIKYIDPSNTAQAKAGFSNNTNFETFDGEQSSVQTQPERRNLDEMSLASASVGSFLQTNRFQEKSSVKTE